jgi:hypothetical protein
MVFLNFLRCFPGMTVEIELHQPYLSAKSCATGSSVDAYLLALGTLLSSPQLVHCRTIEFIFL